ncbi:FtsK/SpoIIIE domain-containing protein [Halobacillus litoralis]|uniref:FtsK/SpoIIIE domain-containing protein n=1 Tax=Halobacillus litoralis TaxID=45668 RepID=UPI001CD51C4A|nr:FtsK/SpoIIIE domain-containing protein [Halobacillus litoralis]MCA1021618.1 DNA translocase FtsK [Halobacillus litoralis]
MFFTSEMDLSKHVKYSDECLNEILKYKEGFGIRSLIWDNELNNYLISPSHRFKEKHVQNPKINLPESRISTYEYNVSSNSFKPLYRGLRGVYERILNYIINKLDSDDYLEVSFVFKYCPKWNTQAVDQLESYLKGNDHPSHIGFIRSVQEKAISWLDRISSFGEERVLHPEYEEKILSPVFAFRGSVVIDSDKEEEIIDWMNKQLSQYDFHNSIRLTKVNSLNPDFAANNVLSSDEILSLFSNESIPQQTTSPQLNDTQILPTTSDIDHSIDPQLEKDLAQALKQVKAINQAKIDVVDHVKGIRLTTIQFKIPKASSFSQIEKKIKDIRAIMGVQSLSIEQGTEAGTVRMLIPNNDASTLLLNDLISNPMYAEYCSKNPLAFPIGFDESNNPLFANLRQLVHLLVAGTSGSGKSVFLNSLALSLLMNHSPEELCMFMIDPKMVELQQFEQFPHVPEVVTEMDKAKAILSSLVKEMERRYTLFKEKNVRNIEGYKEKGNKMEYVVVIIDEYADLVMVEPDVEEYITRLGQKARAAGIHLVLATQRPSADILSSKIQANFQNAVSFNLGNNTNYKTVFGTGIPYNLLGRGDGCFKFEGYDKEFQRFQGCKIALTDLEEEDVYAKMANLYGRDNDFRLEVEPEITQLDQLKSVIANTGETRVGELQKALGIRMNRVQELMSELVDEGWLIKHKARSKGYELIIDEDELNKFKLS